MSADLASLIRLRYPRLLERGNPLYDAVLAAAVEEQGEADVVTVTREEWSVIQEILKASAICANEGGTDRKCCMQTDDHHIPLTKLRSLRSTHTPEATP